MFPPKLTKFETHSLNEFYIVTHFFNHFKPKVIYCQLYQYVSIWIESCQFPKFDERSNREFSMDAGT
jgi:hypothetical protein